jgi:hypothetical protein
MIRRLLSGLLISAIFAFAVISARTAAACSGAKGCHRLDENCGVTCSLTGQDSEYCYYECESTCSEAGTDSCLQAMGLERVN